MAGAPLPEVYGLVQNPHPQLESARSTASNGEIQPSTAHSRSHTPQSDQGGLRLSKETKAKKSKFTSVLVPHQTDPSHSFKRKDQSSSHHSNKRAKVIVYIPYIPSLEDTRSIKSTNQSNQKELSSQKFNLLPETSRSSFQHKHSSPTYDSEEEEEESNPFETQSPPSTRQTTVSLSRPQSPTLAYDSDFNPNQSLPSSDEENEFDEEPNPNQYQPYAVMAPITFRRFKNYFKVKELLNNQPLIDEDNLKESIDEDNLNDSIDKDNLNESINKDNCNEFIKEDDLNEPINEDNLNEPINADNLNESIDENLITQPLDRPFTDHQRDELVDDNPSNQLIVQDNPDHQIDQDVDENPVNELSIQTNSNQYTKESLDQDIINEFIPEENSNQSYTDERTQNQLINATQTHQFASNHLSWTSERPIRISERGEEFYSSIQIDQTILQLSQVVRLNHEPIDLNQFKVSGLDSYSLESDQTSLNHFFWVESLFERDGKKFFHGIRLQKARDTFVRQSAEEYELLLIDQCFEIELAFVQEVLNVEFIFSDQTLDSLPLEGYHCRYRWLPTNGAFVQLERPALPLLATASETQIPCSPSELCRRCTRIPKEIDWIRDPISDEILLGPDDRHLSLGFIINGTETYRLWDHIRFIKTSSDSNSTSTLSKEEIGQIVEIANIRSNLNPLIDLTEEGYKVPYQTYVELENKLKRKQIKVTVRVYDRKAWLGTRDQESEVTYSDDRRIWITSQEVLVDSLEGIVGKCQIDHFIEDENRFLNLNPKKSFKTFDDQIQDIRNSSNHFYSILPTESQQDLFCLVPTLDSKLIPYLSFRENQSIVEENGGLKELVKDYDCMKLSHLELFGGIGSFSLGFSEHHLTDEESTMFIDWSIPACETASINFPKAKVFCADVNEILCLMITGKTRHGRASVKDLRTGLHIFPDQLPKPGDFDLITAGFPCGCHSTLNVLRKGEDSKNALCGTAISFVEFLKPTYVYFENVRGLLKTQLVDRQTQEISTHAFLRLICGTMISLDYQLRFGVLQAAQYGTPQERRRFILTAVKRGFTLPNLPEPTHFYPDNKLQIKLPDQNKITIDFRKKFSRGSLNPITIGATISDLPLFEYRNPMKIMGDFDKRTRMILKQRSKYCTLVNGSSLYMNTEKTDWVGFKKFNYRIRFPINNFQLYLRTPKNEFHEHEVLENGDEEQVINWHVTGRFSEKTVEQIWHIPMIEGADYKDLPEKLKYKEAEPKAHRTKDYFKDFEGNFGRLGTHHLFRTVITKMDPKNQGRTGQVLHPSQHRVLSVLEAQRAQGFPDWFKLSNKSEGVKGLYQQIGNTIPLQLTKSLGLCLWESRERDWIKNQQNLNQEMNELILLDLMNVWEKFQEE